MRLAVYFDSVPSSESFFNRDLLRRKLGFVFRIDFSPLLIARGTGLLYLPGSQVCFACQIRFIICRSYGIFQASDLGFESLWRLLASFSFRTTFSIWYLLPDAKCFRCFQIRNSTEKEFAESVSIPVQRRETIFVPLSGYEDPDIACILYV